MKKILVLLIMLALVLFFSAQQNLVAESTQYIKEAISCSSEDLGKKLIHKYDKLKDPRKQLYQGIVYHNLGAGCCPQYIQKAVETTQAAFERGKYPLALGYLGSSLTIQAREFYEAGDLTSAMEKLQEGILKLDQAIQQGPEDMDLRVLRISHSVQISKAAPIDRYDKIEEDLGFFNSRLAQLPKELKAFFFMYSGLVEKRKNKIPEAMKYFEKVIRVAPKTPYAVRAKKLIKTLEK
jgi:tetratricopeptide (TPR) repeat protein